MGPGDHFELIKNLNFGSRIICGDFAIFDHKNRFDVDLTNKMTKYEFDQTKHRFGILTKNPYNQ